MRTLYATAFRAMGCQTNIWLETESDGEALLQNIASQVEAMEQCLSRFRPASELSHLNAHVGAWTDVSPLLMANLLAAKHGARLTDGLYNPLILDALENAGYDQTFEAIQPHESAHRLKPSANWRAITIDLPHQRVCLPARIDLGGVAKGWAAQTLADDLSAYGACLVDIGGDMAVRGTPAGKSGWEIAVAEPGTDAQKGEILHIALTDSSVVTSGIDFRQWHHNGQLQHHLIDPRTGAPALTDVATVTVIHPHAPTAEVYAKAILMLGVEAGLTWMSQQSKGAALAVRQDGSVSATDNFLNYVPYVV